MTGDHLASAVIKSNLPRSALAAGFLNLTGPIDVQQVSLWSWPALPSTDSTATLIALLLLTAGLATITVTGAQDHRTDPT